MKIVRKGSSNKKWAPVIWGIIFLLLVIAIYFLERGGDTFTVNLSPDRIPAYFGINNAKDDLPILVVDMAFEEYDKILDQREEALETGVFIADENDFVPANVQYEGMDVPVRLRLYQGPHSHLGEEDKWNFDGRTRNNGRLQGMERFYLFDPADNNWQNASVFASVLAKEGILANRVQFVRLFFNGEEKDIYALVEGFGPYLMTSHGREEGVLVEYDVTPIWQTMATYGVDEFDVQNDPITNFSMLDQAYFEVDTFRDNRIAADETLTKQKNAAINSLRGFQSGELSASEVFDIKKYGTYLALTDLWGANEGLSLSNLRFYYNPVTELLEPVAFNTYPLGSKERLPIEATLGDPELQVAYVQAAAEFSQPEYLTNMESEISADFNEIGVAISHEVTVPEPWEELKERQEQMRNSLQPIQPILANLGSPSLAGEGIIQMDVANVLNLPVAVLGFDINGATFLEVDDNWITMGQNNYFSGENGEIILPGLEPNQLAAINFIRFQIPLVNILAVDEEMDFLHDPQIFVAARILGLADNQLIPAQPGFAE